MTELPDALSQLAAPPVLVVGAARSGTTWMIDALSRHPEVAEVMESGVLSRSHGLAGLFHPSNWNEDRRRGGLRPLVARDQLVADVRDLVAGWWATKLEPHHRYLVEKSPTHVWTLPVLAEVWPSSPVVHVLRDGRDVAASTVAAARSWAPRWREGHGASVGAAARAWQDAVLTVERDRDVLGDRLLEVRYEELRADPASGFRRVFAHARIPVTDEQLRDVVVGTDFDRHHDGGEDAFHRSGRAHGWRETASLADRVAFARHGSRGLVVAGYETDRWSWVLPSDRGRKP